MPFASPDPAVIRTWGEACLHSPTVGSPTSVTLVQIDTDTLPDVAPNTLALFGTMTDSGFAVRPVKGDSIQYQGATYQVFEMKQDNAGGTPETAGLHIYLK